MIDLALYSTKEVKSKLRVERDKRDDYQGYFVSNTRIVHYTAPGGTIKINFDRNRTQVV